MTSYVAGGQDIFGWKYMFFQLLSTIKVNLLAKIMQSPYLCVIFHVKLKKIPFVAVLAWFLTLAKIQDGDHYWWCHGPPAALPPIKYTHLIKKIKGLLIKLKWFRNTAWTYQKLRGGVPSISPPPHSAPLYHGGGVNLRVRTRPRVKFILHTV